jgi:methionine-gamma-lyase
MMDNRNLHPESLMMSFGYKPELSEGSVKCPIFQTSTFVFKTAEEGKRFFELAYGLQKAEVDEVPGLIYSRLNNPDLEVLENRLCLWDKAEDCAVFSSGMGAITTVMLEFLQPGDMLLYSTPVYGGTDHSINHVLPKWKIGHMEFDARMSKEEIIKQVNESDLGRLSIIYVESPANPTNALIDLEMCREIADHFSTDEHQVLLVVDNTYMGPLWSHPLELGADLVVYSATKYIGGHSDLIAGAVLGNKELMGRVRGLRTFMGNMCSPFTGWLLMRSLETLKPRMDLQAKNAKYIADFLKNHAKVKKVHYLGHLPEDSSQYVIWKKQYSSAGAMVSFIVNGGEKEAFRFLNALRLIKLAVSLGSTESLAEHPATMTHADVSPEDKAKFQITENLVRISIGVEHHEDIIADITQALDKI